MRPCFYFLLFVTFSACKSHVENTKPKQVVEINTNLDNPLTKKDSAIVIIYAADGDTVYYTNYQLKKILEYNPELSQDITEHPDETYWKRTKWRTIKEKDKATIETFTSESGQDVYYLLYAYFLRGKNASKVKNDINRKLITLLRTINKMHSYMQNGGTYFGHQYYRIIGYAAYAAYDYDEEDAGLNSNTTDVQKRFFLSSLRRYVSDKVNDDKNNGLTPTDKINKVKELIAITTKLDSLITSAFLLRQAQRFEYGYY